MLFPRVDAALMSNGLSQDHILQYVFITNPKNDESLDISIVGYTKLSCPLFDCSCVFSVNLKTIFVVVVSIAPQCEPWCWYIYLQNWVIYGVNVGKYSSTMEHMGLVGRFWEVT